MSDRIADIWGPRTAYARGHTWPARVDAEQRLTLIEVLVRHGAPRYRHFRSGHGSAPVFAGAGLPIQLSGVMDELDRAIASICDARPFLRHSVNRYIIVLGNPVGRNEGIYGQNVDLARHEEIGRASCRDRVL